MTSVSGLSACSVPDDYQQRYIALIASCFWHLCCLLLNRLYPDIGMNVQCALHRDILPHLYTCYLQTAAVWLEKQQEWEMIFFWSHHINVLSFMLEYYVVWFWFEIILILFNGFRNNVSLELPCTRNVHCWLYYFLWTTFTETIMQVTQQFYGLPMGFCCVDCCF